MAKEKKQQDDSKRLQSTAAAPVVLRTRRERSIPTPAKYDAEWELFKSHLLDLLVALIDQFQAPLAILFEEVERQLAGRALPVLLPPASPPQPHLTRREVEIVRLMAMRYSNERIIDELFIEMTTLKTHQRHIFKKLGNRGKVLEWWERHRGYFGQ